MITRVRVKNYKSLADVDVELGPLTVLVGPNGSGKSNFIDALWFLKHAVVLGIDEAIRVRGGMTSISRQPSRARTVSISLQLASPGLRAEFGFDLTKDSDAEYSVSQEFGEVDWPFIREQRVGDKGHMLAPEYKAFLKDKYRARRGIVVDPPRFPKAWMADADESVAARVPVESAALVLPLNPSAPWSALRGELASMAFYSINPRDIRDPQKPGREDRLEQDGRNLASILRNMRRGKSKWWPELKAALQVVVDDISDVSVRAAGSYLIIELKHELGDSRTATFDAAQESDGTLRILGLLAAAYQDPPPTLLAIEEPELTVHPGASAVLCDVLREASRRTQVLLSTHSPDLLNRFAAEELRVVERREGVTTISRVHPTQVEVINKKLFAPGELLQVEGLRPADQA